MFKFFRKIRINSIKTNQIRKYLLYALGEIILVVLGILIALQINNWNEQSKLRKTEHQYLLSIKDEIIADSLRLERRWFKNYEKKKNALTNVRDYIHNKVSIRDTIEFINEAGFGGVHSRASFLGESNTFKELLSTGNLGNISDKKLRGDISIFYGQKDFLSRYAKSIRSGYADKMNALKSFDPSDPSAVNVDEIDRILKNIRTEEFNDLLNHELSYAYAMNRSLKRFKTHCNSMNRQLAAYIEENFN